jgi:signal transduction histidine kinase
VSDTGQGMTPEVRARAIEPFFTTKGETGTGLGLSQVYGFMQQLGGQVSIDSTPGRGTAVHLFFPVAAAVSAG